MIGQGLVPRDYHPLVDALSRQELDEFMDNVRDIVAEAVAALPDHEQYLNATGRTSVNF
jgi:tryptophan halogenase